MNARTVLERNTDCQEPKKELNEREESRMGEIGR